MSGRRPTEEEVKNTGIVPHSGSTNGLIHPETINNLSPTESNSAREFVETGHPKSNSEQQSIDNPNDSVDTNQLSQNGHQGASLKNENTGLERDNVDGKREGPQSEASQQQQPQAPNRQQSVNQNVSVTNTSDRVPVNPNTYQKNEDKQPQPEGGPQPGQEPQQGQESQQEEPDNSKKSKNKKKRKIGGHILAHVAAVFLTFWACTCCCHVPCCCV